jgi:hypothetical protein
MLLNPEPKEKEKETKKVENPYEPLVKFHDNLRQSLHIFEPATYEFDIVDILKKESL